jgi:hypothetical protein
VSALRFPAFPEASFPAFSAYGQDIPQSKCNIFFITFQAGIKKIVSSCGYFLGLGLGGLPLPGTLRIFSHASLGYMASLVIGFIPALRSRCLAARYVMPKYIDEVKRRAGRCNGLPGRLFTGSLPQGTVTPRGLFIRSRVEYPRTRLSAGELQGEALNWQKMAGLRPGSTIGPKVRNFRQDRRKGHDDTVHEFVPDIPVFRSQRIAYLFRSKRRCPGCQCMGIDGIVYFMYKNTKLS